MTSWLKALLIAGGTAAGAAAIAAAVYFGLPYIQQKAPAAAQAPVTSSTSPDFTKTAYQVDSSGNLVLDSNGDPVPFTGPVHPGDEVEYVLTYKLPANVPTTIVDTLSANQTYVDPSIQAAGWTYPTTPAYAGNTETYTLAASGSAGFVLNVPAISGTAGVQTGGDGFEPIPVLTSAGVKVFAINHHQPYSGNPQVMCWFGASLTPCSSAYAHDTSVGPDRRATPDFPHAVIYQKKIYFPAGRYNDSTFATLEFGLGCWDAEADATCPFVGLPGAPSLAMGGSSGSGSYLGTRIDDYLSGLRADPANPTHAYIYALGKIYCVDLAASGMPACTGWVVPTISPTNTAGARGTDLFADENGTRLFFSNSVGGQGTVRCFNFSDGSTCAGWAPGGVTGGATNATILGPGLDSTGNMKAICFSQTFNTAPNFRCFDTLTSANVTGPAAPSWPTGFLSGHAILAPYHIPGTKKVLFPPYSNNSVPVCYDYANTAGCTGFSPYWRSNQNWPASTGPNPEVSDYGYAVDPVSPENCIYGYGDGKVLVRFKQNGTAATGECAPKTYTATYNLDDQFCAQKPHSATWTTLDIVNRPTELVGGTITIKDSAGNTLQTITVTAANSYTVNLPATGANGTVTVAFTPNYGGNAPPTTGYQLKLNYTADANPQICYKTKILDCTQTLAQGPVTNTAVYTDANGSNQASVNLGKVVGGHCGPPPCLLDLIGTITLNPDGTGTLTISGAGPPGFNPTILNVHTTTPGVGIAPPTRTVPPGPINATFTLTGITPGESIDVQIDAVEPGGGTNGSDKCCSSTITVVVPQQRDHQTDVGIQKTGVSEGQGPANGSGYTYTLSVTNYGIPINGQNIIVVTDVVPAGLSFASASGTDWTCTGPFPIAAGGTLTCTYTGSAMLATGQVLAPITVVSTNAVPGAQLPTVTNCADVAFVPGNGIMDSKMSNNHSCTTNSSQAAGGTLTVVKLVTPTHGHAVPAMTFLANVSCVPPSASAITATLALNQADSFKQVVSNLPSGSVCSITEPPPALPTDLPASCRWVTTYPDGQQATIASGNATLHIVNTEDCTTQPGTTVLISKVTVIDGRVSRAPHESFPIRANCVVPGGAPVNLSYTASAAAGFDSAKQSVPRGTKCTVREPAPPPPPGRRQCHWETSYLFNSRPVRSFPVTIGERPTNVIGVQNELVCDNTNHDTDEFCADTGHWNGRRCVTCGQGEAWDAVKKICTVPQLKCHAPMVLNEEGTACACPEGTTLKNSTCQKRGSFFGDIFGHVHIGVGGGSGGGHQGGGATPPGK